MDKNHRSYKHLYDKARWVRKARLQRTLKPLCEICLANGIVAPAEVADHIEPHNGDPQKFWFGELQSLCCSCHNSVKQTIEHRGFSLAIGIDGFPIDPRHPSNVLARKQS